MCGVSRILAAMIGCDDSKLTDDVCADVAAFCAVYVFLASLTGTSNDTVRKRMI